MKDQATVAKYLDDARKFMFTTTQIDNDHWKAHSTLAIAYEERNILAVVQHLKQCVRVTMPAPISEDILNANPDDIESLIFLATINAMSPSRIAGSEYALRLVEAGLQATDVCYPKAQWFRSGGRHSNAR